MPKKVIGTNLIVISALFYASYGIWTALMGDFFGGFTASGIRSVLVIMILFPAALVLGRIKPFELHKNWKPILSMILISTLIWGLLYYSVLTAGVGVSLTVNYAAIVVGMVFFGWLLAGEKFTTVKGLSLAVGVFGVSLIFIDTYTGGSGLTPLFAAVVSGLAIAANSVIAKQLPYNAMQTTVVLWGTSIIANFPMMLLLSEPIPAFGLYVEWFYMLLFAITSILSSLALMKGLKYIDAGIAGIIGLLEIVFAVIFGVFLFGEEIRRLTIVGVNVIIVAAGLPYIYQLYSKRAVSRKQNA